MPVNKQSVRLPKHISPQRYRIMMRPDFTDHTFSGQETIFLTLGRATNAITLHAVDLKISQAKLRYKIKQKTVELKPKISFDKKSEIVTFTFAEKIPTGKAELDLEFSGVLNEQLHGFYKSSYEHKGKKQYIATTQFEATDARKAFPSFDEPAHKAIFDVTLIVPKNLTALSNTIEKSSRNHDAEYKVVKFVPTPKMSTYLLAFIVGDFESIETNTKDGVVIRVFTTPGKSAQGQFALETGKRTIEFLNEYFAIPYPLPVMDMIAIPDFSSAAMENWGAVTYREAALLIDEQTPFMVRQRVAEVVAHELVHQWFGNLVTMEWWTHLWLNEGFASYMSYVVLDHLFPEWNVWTRYAVDVQSLAYSADSLHSTHPVEVEVHHPHEITEAFDSISYDKGSFVLHMLSHYLTPDVFRDGLRYYLKKHSYKNTSTVHLWEAFEKVSGKPVRQFMKTWTTQPGYPFLKASQRNGRFQIEQNRFLRDGKLTNQLWPIPVQVEFSPKQRSEITLFNKSAGTISISPGRSYAKINPEERSMYRVLYSPELLAELLPVIKSKELNTLDRWGIVRDVFAFIQQGGLPTITIFEVLKTYEEEQSYVIWTEIESGLRAIEKLLADTPSFGLFRQYCAGLFAKQVKKYGWQFSAKDSNARTLLRALVIREAGYYGHKPTTRKAVQLFNAEQRGKNLPADLRPAIYAVVARHGSVKQFEQYETLYKASRSPEEKSRLGRAMMLFPQASLLKRALKFALSDQVRSQDAVFMLVAALQNLPQRHKALDFVLKNWEALLKHYGGSYLLGRIISRAGGFSDQMTTNKMLRFFKTHKTPGATRAVKQALEKQAVNRAWLKRDYRSIERYLRGPGSVAK
jgi:aminopeptidase N